MVSDRIDPAREAGWAARGLYDPADVHVAERLELLRWVAAHGVSDQQIVEAVANRQLTSVVGDLALRPGPRLTIGEVAARSGLTVDQVKDLRRNSGFPDAAPDERVATEADVGMFELFALAGTFFSGDELLHFSRVMGSAIRRVAEAAAEMFLRDVEAPMDRYDPANGLAIAKANLAAIELVGAATNVFDPMFRGHLELAVSTTRQALAGVPGYDYVPLTIGFVDLDGFTSNSATLSPRELVALVNRLEATALGLLGEHNGRLVKLIGDEVMFTTVEPAAACEVAAGMVHAAAEWGSSARGGVAHGPVVPAGGDVYGVTVNLAARIVDVAVAGEVLVDASVAERATGRRFEPAGRRQLKGFVDPVPLWSLAG